MALTSYQDRTRQLLQNPAAPTNLYTTTNLNGWINTARGRLAGDTACVRLLTTISTVAGQRNYSFSNITIPSGAGIEGIINIEAIHYGVNNTGYQIIYPRSWQWFSLYAINNPVVFNGPPTTWSQFGQGAAPPSSLGVGSSGGSFYLDPPPDIIYGLLVDCSCYPSALTSDSDPEAIPYLWTDAIPFLAAWYALLSAQMQARRADAEAFYNYYQEYVQRSRNAANPMANKYLYQGAGDPANLNKLGVSPPSGKGGNGQ